MYMLADVFRKLLIVNITYFYTSFAMASNLRLLFEYKIHECSSSFCMHYVGPYKRLRVMLICEYMYFVISKYI